MVRVTPSLSNLRTPHSYEELKMLLLDTYGLSDEWALEFANITELGDHRPSEIMDQMLLHGCEEPNSLLRHAFKRLLPPAV